MKDNHYNDIIYGISNNIDKMQICEVRVINTMYIKENCCACIILIMWTFCNTQEVLW